MRFQIMKVFVFLSLWRIIQAEDYFDTVVQELKYPILGEDVVRARMSCFLDTGPCDDIALTFKQNLKEALYTKCSRCSEMQRKTAWAFWISVEQVIPFELDKWKHKYDPENKYFDDFMVAIQPREYK